MKLFERKLYEINPVDLEGAKDLVAKFYNIPKEIFDRIRIEYTRLPYLIEMKRFGNHIYLFVKRILGMYDVSKKKIYIDKNLPYMLKILTLLHELVHAAQDYIGRIYRKSKEFIEAEARKVSEYLFYLFRKYFKY
jgi:Zn-dependent peptidase ImmA (M78 family)